jgi:hypothetical protein
MRSGSIGSVTGPGQDGQRMVGAARAEGVGGLPHQLHQVGVLHAQRCLRLRRVQPGEQQQVVQEDAHAGSLGAQPGQVPVAFLGGVGGGVLEEVGVTAHRHQRGAQFVRGVGDEAAQPLLGLRAYGEGVVDVLQHRVEGGAQFVHLGAAVPAVGAQREPGRRLGQVVRGDAVRGGRHVTERFQTAAQHPAAEDDQREQGEGEGDDLDRDQLPDRVLDVFHRCGADEDHPGLDLAGAQPVGARAHEVLGAQDLLVRGRLGPGEGGEVVDVLRQIGGVLGPAELGRAVPHVVHGVEPAVVLLSRQRAVVRDALGLGELGLRELGVELGRQIVPHVRGQCRADDGEHHQGQGTEAQGQPGAQAHPAVGPPQPGDHSAACRSTYPKPRTV